MRLPATCILLTLVTARLPAADSVPGSLEARLLAEGVEVLARDAVASGDAKRGAVAFHQPTLACRGCHTTNGEAGAVNGSIGPDLTTWHDDAKPTTAHLVESLLQPSKTIRKGFESAVVVKTDGRVLTGRFVTENDGAVTLRLPRPNGAANIGESSGEVVVVPADEIEEWRRTTESLMPAGVVNQLGTRQQFLDLVAYVDAIANGGPKIAGELAPPAALLTARPLPEYEAHVDHAGLIRGFDNDGFQRGKATYERLCINCHGDHDRPGTLPTSRRFGTEPLKNGHDPYAMYQTLTRGFGMMVPQHWMVPRQKYDVVHYVREDYLKPGNPSQFFDVTDEYLASLPAGDTYGPEPSAIEPWVAMDYGDSLINTYEFGGDGRNIAYKGIAVRLDGGPGGVSRGRAWAVFEHDTLRLAGFWTGNGFIDWNGIHFNGRHNAHPHVVGTIHVENTGPGWANPATGAFDDDQRVVGRDDRRYGPLPRAWGRYTGLHRFGSQAIVDYRVGNTRVLETPGLVEAGEAKNTTPVLTRSFEIGPRDRAMTLAVATRPGDVSQLRAAKGHVTFGPRGGARLLELGASSNGPSDVESPIQPDDRSRSRASGSFDGASYLEVADGGNVDTTKSFTMAARIRTKQGGTILARTTAGPKWVPGGQVLFVRGGRLCYDIGWVGVVQSDVPVADGKWHDVAVSFDAEQGVAALVVDGRPAGSKRIAPENELEKPVLRIGYCAPDFPSPTGFRGDIREVQLFATALDDDELVRLAGNGPIEEDRLRAHWVLGRDTVVDGQVANSAGEGFVAHVRHGTEAATEARAADGTLVAGVSGAAGLEWTQVGERLCLVVPPGDETLRFTVWTANVEHHARASALAEDEALGRPSPDLAAMTGGGPPSWPQPLKTQPIVAEPTDDAPFAIDVLTRPEANPWLAQVRLTGFDFFGEGDRAAVSAWDGDVWLVSGLLDGTHGLTWRRIASGLFQPLGVKVVGETIYVTCRDQLVVLHDENGDGETDFYEAFNSDHQVTEHFHEFAMGLQRDAAGNFYYAKSARHALPAIVPHHGTLLRVSADGERTDILATGFRAANGVCLNPDGTFFVTDQEGHWNPKNRINWVREGGFYGNMLGYHDVTNEADDAMEQPLAWITNAFDRSPAELLWVDSENWGPLDGSLLNLSYGYGKVYVVPHEVIGTGEGAVMQGGMSPLPLPNFPTGLMRGRFGPGDGQLYAAGMFAWGGNQQQPGGFYRIRWTRQPTHLPIEFHARKGELELGFSGPFDRASATDPSRYTVRVWGLERSKNYGSKHIDERTLTVEAVRLSENGRTLVLAIPGLAPTRGLSVRWEVKSAEGKPVPGELHGTIHVLP